jgi:hypothetical protein
MRTRRTTRKTRMTTTCGRMNYSYYPTLRWRVKVDTQHGDPVGASTMDMIKILYNDSYDADFGFSEEFDTAYKARTGREVNTTIRLYRIGADSVRRDPVAIAIVEALGVERASAPGAYLQIREIPAMFERYWSVEASFGTETVHVDVNEAFADVLHHYMDTGDSAALVTQYRKVKTAVGRMSRADDAAIGLTEMDRAPLLKRDTGGGTDECGVSKHEHGPDGGYGYFDTGDTRIGHT